ncbi:hypothetical protein [Actinospongicola halichondriae]|uniref:hypothetical protein n=1 Tax=Actinospongicola halichondriae TaxID=3236844 RepID=UPI003D45B12C
MSVTPLPHVEHLDPPHDAVATPTIRPPSPDEILAWWLRVLGELGRAPFTLYRVRKLISAMSRLPGQLEALTAALDRTTDTLETRLSSMDGRLGELQETFEAVDGRIGNLEGTVGELTSTVTNLIGAIPGARRTLRKQP